MKKILILVMPIVLTVLACTNDDPTPDAIQNQDVLGVVLQNTSSNNNVGIILLSDGRAINPVSGFTNFSQTRIGSKYVLSFDVISSAHELLEVNVKKFSKSENSSFSITQDSSLMDSTIVNTASLNGTFQGTFTYQDFAHSDTTHTNPVTIDISNLQYTSSASLNGFPSGGSGVLSLNDLDKKILIFNNTQNIPRVNPDLILNGSYNILAFDNYLALIRSNTQSFTSYIVKKKF